jgi:riboflavin kinase
VGKTPLEAAAAVVEDYELPCSTDDFLTQITPLLYDQ